MIQGLLIAIALGGLVASPTAQQTTAPSPVQLLREACVATDLKRAAFDDLANERGWSPRPHVPSDDMPGEWGSGYSEGSVQLLLMGQDRNVRRGGMTYPAFVSCNVVIVDPPEGWREDMAALASELGYRLFEPDFSRPWGTPSKLEQEWHKKDGFIRSSYGENDRILRLEIYRELGGVIRFPLR